VSVKSLASPFSTMLGMTLGRFEETMTISKSTLVSESHSMSNSTNVSSMMSLLSEAEVCVGSGADVFLEDTVKGEESLLVVEISFLKLLGSV
jgi:hypothetical protein